MKINPYRVFEGLQDKTRVPETELERSLFVQIHGSNVLNKLLPLRPWDTKTMLDPSIEYPWLVFNMPEVRAILEAFLLATDNDYEIYSALRMPADEVTAYRKLFFDTTVFRTDLELIVFLRKFTDTEATKKLYRIAFHQGVGALRWHLCRDKGAIDPEDVVKTVMTDAFYRALEHRGTPLANTLTREASNYARLSLECARTLLRDRSPGHADIEDLRIRFEEARKTRTVHDLKLETGGEEVLH